MMQLVNQEIFDLKQRIIDDMIDYMKYGGAESEDDPEYDPEFDTGYTQKHIDQFSVIIDEFLT